MMDAHRIPQRPARGLPAEQALEHWSDPDAYAAMREYWAHRTLPFFTVAGAPPDPRELEYDRRRRPLEEALLARLRTGELMATAIPENADPTASRMLVDPEVFSHGSLVFENDVVVAPNGEPLRFVEIFEPPGVPCNVRIIPEWYREQHEPAQAPTSALEEMTRKASGFRQKAGYRYVWINDAEFTLTRTQGRVVKLLHEAHLRDDPWQFGKTILAEAGSGSTRMVQVFRDHKAPHWSLLIESDKRGHYRLNIQL